MSLPIRWPFLRSAAKPWAFAAACLVVSVSAVAGAAAPAQPEWCGPALSRLSEAALRLGYSIIPDAGELAATGGRSSLQATCATDHVMIELAEESGVRVRVAATPAGLEVVGQYPGVGMASRTAVFESPATDPAGGSLTFTAESPAGSAFVEFDGAGEVLGEDGDAAVVNEQLAPILNTSAWQDAHVLTLALADGPATGDEQLAAGLYLATAVVVPNPRASGVKTSMVGMALGCGKAAAVCTLAATWLPTIAGACYTDSVACAFAIGCAVTSCVG